MAPGVETVCSSPPSFPSASRLDVDEPQLPVLAALHRRQPVAEPGRRRRAEVEVARLELGLVRRRPASEQLRVLREPEQRVAPVRLAVERAVAGRDEQRAGLRLDDGAAASPDRGVAPGATARDDQLRVVGAERVPDVQQLAAARVDDGDVPLVRRLVADVAAGRREHVPVREVEGRRDLLARGQQRDRPAPQHVTVRDAQLLDPPVGRRRVDRRAAGVGDRCRGRDAIAAGPRRVARRRVAPQPAARRRVDRLGLPVRRRHEEDVVRLPADAYVVEVDRRRVDRAVEPHALPPQVRDVLRRDPGRSRPAVRAHRDEAEHAPVRRVRRRLRRARRRTPRGLRRRGRRGRASRSRDRRARPRTPRR